jgi:hypothetical protein
MVPGSANLMRRTTIEAGINSGIKAGAPRQKVVKVVYRNRAGDNAAAATLRVKTV